MRSQSLLYRHLTRILPLTTFRGRKGKAKRNSRRGARKRGTGNASTSGGLGSHRFHDPIYPEQIVKVRVDQERVVPYGV